jgi:prephenate dehydratase
MNQSQVINLDVKLSLNIDNETSLKRIPAVQTHKDLHDQCRQFINKLQIPKVSSFNIVYFDSDNERIKVEDDSDLQMAYAVALSADGKLKFHIEIGKVQA